MGRTRPPPDSKGQIHSLRARAVLQCPDTGTVTQPIMSAAVGQDIESICRKCGDVWHVVVAMVEDKVVKVQCKQCNGYHRHKPPGSATPAPRRARAAAGGSSPSPRSHEPQVAADLTRAVKPYRFDGEYSPGDRLEHPKFGEGIVELTTEPGKMQVFFSDGRRVLARAKQSSGLERPRPFQSGTGGEPD